MHQINPVIHWVAAVRVGGCNCSLVDGKRAGLRSFRQVLFVILGLAKQKEIGRVQATPIWQSHAARNHERRRDGRDAGEREAQPMR